MEEQVQKDLHLISAERIPAINKKIIISCLLLVALSVLLGMISFIPVYSDFFFTMAKACQLLAFLAAGLIYTQLSYKLVSASDNINSKDYWLYTLLLTLFICAALFLLFLFANRRMPMIAFGCSSAFLLPFIIKQSWYYYSSVLIVEQEIRRKKAGDEKVRLKEINDKRTILRETKRKESYENNLRQKQEEVKRKQIQENKQQEKRQPIIKEKQSGDNEIKPNEIKPKTPGKNNKNKIWFYKEPGMDMPTVILLNTVQVYLQLNTKFSEPGEELFSTSAPLDMKLGDFFNHFINVTRKTNKLKIDFFDDKQMSFGWKFYANSLMGLKKIELDPALSLRENKIKELGIIIASRSQV